MKAIILIYGIFQLLLIVLKLSGTFNLKWWAVFIPVYIVIVIMIGAIIYYAKNWRI